MKGIVFAEFLEMVEQKFGILTVEEIIEKSNLKSNGVYTAVGTYDFGEMLLLLQNLSAKSNISIPELLKTYGRYFFNILNTNYAQLVQSHDHILDFLMSVENHIHIEVIKLYPEAELPSFKMERVSDSQLNMVYKSARKLFYFAQGLIEGAFKYYNVKGEIINILKKNDGEEVSFSILIYG